MTSPTRGATVALVAAVAVVCLLVGLAAGYALRGPGGGGNRATPSGTLSITAAGTLGSVFPQIADALVNATPGAEAPAAAQQYEGSISALNAIAQLHGSYDVAAAADYHLIPSLLEPVHAGWEVGFATTPEALAYDPSATALAGINASNWASKLEQPGVVLGVANASTDPNGYNEIFTLELEGLAAGGSLASVYGHFFTTPVGSLAVPNPSTARLEPETMAALLLSTHVVQAFIIYQSYAEEHHLAYVALNGSVSLGDTSSAAIAAYARASTTILTATGGSEVVTGAPVVFAATVPTDAPNATLGTAFVHFLLSPVGAATLVAGGFVPLTPGWLQSTGTTPSWIVADTEPFPSDLPVPVG